VHFGLLIKNVDGRKKFYRAASYVSIGTDITTFFEGVLLSGQRQMASGEMEVLYNALKTRDS